MARSNVARVYQSPRRDVRHLHATLATPTTRRTMTASTGGHLAAQLHSLGREEAHEGIAPNTLAPLEEASPTLRRPRVHRNRRRLRLLAAEPQRGQDHQDPRSAT